MLSGALLSLPFWRRLERNVSERRPLTIHAQTVRENRASLLPLSVRVDPRSGPLAGSGRRRRARAVRQQLLGTLVLQHQSAVLDDRHVRPVLCRPAAPVRRGPPHHSARPADARAVCRCRRGVLRNSRHSDGYPSQLADLADVRCCRRQWLRAEPLDTRPSPTFRVRNTGRLCTVATPSTNNRGPHVHRSNVRPSVLDLVSCLDCRRQRSRGRKPRGSVPGRYLFPWMPALAAIVVITAPFGPIARKTLDVWPLRWLGLISYGVYIFHVPCMQVVRHFLRVEPVTRARVEAPVRASQLWRNPRCSNRLVLFASNDRFFTGSGAVSIEKRSRARSTVAPLAGQPTTS